jgi:hypothetical protein
VNLTSCCRSFVEILKNQQRQHHVVVVAIESTVVISIAAILTYGFTSAVNIQIAIMTVITLFGAIEQAFSFTSLTIPASIGAFVGGHNILNDSAQTIQYTEYLWLTLLSIVVGLVWQCVIQKY